MKDTEFLEEYLKNPKVAGHINKAIDTLEKYRVFGFLREASDTKLKVAMESVTGDTNLLITQSAKKYGYVEALDDLQNLIAFKTAFKKVTKAHSKSNYGVTEDDLE